MSSRRRPRSVGSSTPSAAPPPHEDALTKDPLQAVLAPCDESLRGMRDRALLMFAWSTGGRRRSEVAAADLAFLQRTGPGEYSFCLTHSKTNQAGADLPENHKLVVGPASDALNAWRDAAGIVEGRIFRQVRKRGHLGAPFSPAAVRDIVRSRCQLAGVTGDFSAHSLCSRFVTEAGRQGVPVADTMAMTGHRSLKSVLGYTRVGSAGLAESSRMLQE